MHYDLGGLCQKLLRKRFIFDDHFSKAFPTLNTHSGLLILSDGKFPFDSLFKFGSVCFFYFF